MKAKLLLATALAAVTLILPAPVSASDECIDRDCTTIALFDTPKEASGAKPETPTAAQRYGTWGVDLAGMDTSIKPGDDFFRYVNGTWAAKTEIPADKTRYGAFEMLRDLSEVRVRGILDGWAAKKDLAPGSDEAKVASVYRSFLDEARVETLGLEPLEPQLKAIRKAKNRTDVARLMGRSMGSIGGSFFTASVSDDAKNPDKYALYLSQSGLGLPDREF